MLPALARSLAPGQGAERVGDEEEARCFYHADARAVVPCGECGRFLCGLCDLEWRGAHVCPACLERLRAARDSREPGSRVLWGQWAMITALILPLLYPLTLLLPVTAPAAVALGFVGLRSAGSATGRGRWLCWAGVVIGLIETVAVVIGLVFMADAIRQAVQSR
jgi:hypothetical protein